MACAVLCLLALWAAACSSSIVSAQNCTNSPVWIFSRADDLRSIFQGIESDLVLVAEGVPDDVLTDRQFATQNLILSPNVDEISLTWCITADTQSIRYSVSLESDKPNIVEHPTLTVPLEGTITTAPYRFRLVFRCFPSDSRSVVGITLSVNSSSLTGEQYCPVQIFFGKGCSREGSSFSSGESPTTLEALGITDGFLDGVSIGFKSPSTILVPNNSVVPDVLKGVLIPLCILALLALVGGPLAWVVWYRKSKSKIAEFHPEAVGQAYMELYGGVKTRGDHEKEFPLTRLSIERELGEGAFGVVSQAQAQGIVEGETFTNVAVKQLRAGSDEVGEFFKEVDFMTGLEHPNIVRLLGVCSQDEPFSMIFEYMDLGDLCSFLREAIGLGKDVGDNEQIEGEDALITEPLLTNEELLTIALQVAEGMVYISSKHLVHRDLAARNCLVATGLLVKIADFGMSRNINTTDYYRVKGNAMLPVRWMPPESVLYGKFTVESDIWAFGVLLWEIFTFGQQPYSGLENAEVILRIKECKHPDPPPECPAHQLMIQCWNKNPKKRPLFQESKTQIQQLLHTVN